MDKDLAEAIVLRYVVVGWPTSAIVLAVATLFWLPKLVEQNFGGCDRD